MEATSRRVCLWRQHHGGCVYGGGITEGVFMEATSRRVCLWRQHHGGCVYGGNITEGVFMEAGVEYWQTRVGVINKINNKH